MPSEVIVRGTVHNYIAAVDTDRPDAPNIAPAVAWGVLGDDYYTDDGIAVRLEQSIDVDTILNEIEAVDAYRSSMVKGISGQLRNLTAEALFHALNRNPVTEVIPTGTEVGYKEIDFEVGPLVRQFAILCRVDGSAYDMPNTKSVGFRTEIWFPRCFEMSGFETVLSPKGDGAMVPFNFQGLKSDVAANKATIRIANLATT